MIPCPEEARGDVEVSLQDRDSFPKIPGILAKKKPWYNIVRKKSTIPTKPELCSVACTLDILAFS